ncbi:MAG: Gfo/Idh/MocA family oxidoreductase [Candidatus Bathyarchaeota archaeon]|nr:Gfo/Idh/MocA family oxidoreductase [Candidatus Bathyarchaeota archaeon]MDH5788361.1 Gfo/Idh/MocA family oxidoreductase [Candidatus Bathyarchaeota archaeon]
MKVGIIGCGGIAPLHIKAYKKLENVEVVGLCDLNQERARKLAARFHIDKTFEDYWSMFEKKDLDLVDICTPVSTHAKIVCDAAEAVQAILVEKPMALNVSECEEMINKVKKHGSKLCIGHSQIFSPHIQKTKSMVDSGAFDLFSFRTTLKGSFETLRAYDLAAAWNIKPEQKGIIWEVCCHHAYLQLHFLPDIKEVYAVGSKVKYPVYDDFSVILRTAGERFGIIELSWVTRETEVIYELRDSKGRRVEINWEFDQMLEKIEDPPFTVGLVARNILVDQKRLIQKWTKFATCYFNGRKLLPTFNLISSYIESIEKDLQPPVSPEDGRNTISLLESIEKSLDEKRPVAVKH